MPYKVRKYQQQQQPILTIDNKEICDRATSPIRLPRLVKQVFSPVKVIQSSTSSILTPPNQGLLSDLAQNRTKTPRSSSKLSVPMFGNRSDDQSSRLIAE